MVRLHVPMRAPEDMAPQLTKTAGDWTAGRSAYALAATWWAANGLPPKVRQVLAGCPALAQAELIEALLEREGEPGDGRRPSQSDLLALLALPDRLAVAAVEARQGEGFDRLVGDWLAGDGKSPPAARQGRLRLVAELLGLDPQGPATMGLHWLLLHRAAVAVIEARRWRSQEALMLVHSFGPYGRRGDGFEDFARFAAALGAGEAQRDAVVGPVMRFGISLRLGWVADTTPGSAA